MNPQTSTFPAALLLSFALATVTPAVDVVLTADPPGPVEVGDELTVQLSVNTWDATDPEVDAIAFNVDFDLAVFEFVSGSGTTIADGSEFLALPSQAAGYNLGDDSSESLVGFGRYIFGASDTGDGTAGSLGPDGKLGSFRLRAIAPGTGTIGASTNMPKLVFADPDFYGIDPTGGVGLGSVDVEVLPPGVTYASWAAGIPFASEKDAQPDSDPDCDGRNNALEYYLGGDPLVPDVERDPQAGTMGGLYATLIFERPAGAAARTDAKCSGERSTDLRTWARGDVVVESVSPIDPATGRETVVLRSTVLFGSEAREFMRLAVELDL